MFHLNPDLEIIEEYVLDSKVYIIKNFYKNPDDVAEYLFNKEVPLWKEKESPSFNGLFFNDRRFTDFDKRLSNAYNFLKGLCNQSFLYDESTIITNMTRFSKHSFNDYKNCVWWPHVDNGYNGIVYLNKDENNCGTNLYSPELFSSKEWKLNDVYSEHYLSWRPKENYRIAKTFKSYYNSLVLFDGKKFPHGMNISNDRFLQPVPLMCYPQANWNYYRCNQVFFFKE
jgi:hypothetical protein